MLDANDAPAARPGAGRGGTLRGAQGFFRVGQDENGRWTLIAPDDRSFFCKAVHGVRRAIDGREGLDVPDSVARLRRWGFNTLGVGSESSAREDGLPFLGVVDFFGTAAAIVAPGARLPDVFDPDWPARAIERAQSICSWMAEERQLMGWVGDDRLRWAQPSIAGRPSLLQLCLSLEPSFAAYHAAWEFVLALHDGRLEELARAWAVKMPNKEMVRELTRAEEGIGTRGYLRDETRWSREFARRYFTGIGTAIRRADPNHLVLGCCTEGPMGPAVLAECVYPAVDVVMCDWRELPAPVDGAQPGPVIASNVAFASAEFQKLPTAARVLRLTSVEWMLRRGRTTLERMGRHPAVVGYAWGRWLDEPGEQPPFGSGLVHVNGVEAREHTELLTHFNTQLEVGRTNLATTLFQR